MTAHIVLDGRIGKRGELKQADGSSVKHLGFTCATTTWKPGRNGADGIETTTWWHVRIFGRAAEGLSLRLAVGDRVIVRGVAEQQEWTGKDGSNRTSLNVIADHIDIASPKRQAQGSAPVSSPVPAPATASPAVGAAINDEPPF